MSGRNRLTPHQRKPASNSGLVTLLRTDRRQKGGGCGYLRYPSFGLVKMNSIRRGWSLIHKGERNQLGKPICNGWGWGQFLIWKVQTCTRCTWSVKLILHNGRIPEKPKGSDLSNSELTVQWNSIDWTTVKESVSNLQTRITRAALDGKWHKVNQLIRLLTRSYNAKLLAVRQVTQSKGKNTPGIDEIVWRTPAEKMQAVLNLNTRGYRACP